MAHQTYGITRVLISRSTDENTRSSLVDVVLGLLLLIVVTFFLGRRIFESCCLDCLHLRFAWPQRSYTSRTTGHPRRIPGSLPTAFIKTHVHACRFSWKLEPGPPRDPLGYPASLPRWVPGRPGCLLFRTACNRRSKQSSIFTGTMRSGLLLAALVPSVSWVLDSPLQRRTIAEEEGYERQSTVWQGPQSFNLSTIVSRWSLPADPFTDAELGSGISWALHPCMAKL